MNPEDYFEVIAADLDRFAAVPDEVLLEIVTRDGRCLWLVPVDESPEWDGEELTERELAARLCAECSARRACLELELRTAGAGTVGLWGGLSTEDRRALYPVWLSRRGQMGGSS
ncbi:WhiB family transcriptional regulator [Saccharothrix sp. HUAS TT1]|uniref:WhiB family transcriptional regulator n=1 Tax=unclassified Saccharothrix TaxID=2593673 RepID=UPI00345B5F51